MVSLHFLVLFMGSIVLFQLTFTLWVLVSSTGKVFDGCIRDLGFNPSLHQKLIGVLVW